MRAGGFSSAAHVDRPPFSSEHGGWPQGRWALLGAPKTAAASPADGGTKSPTMASCRWLISEGGENSVHWWEHGPCSLFSPPDRSSFQKL